MCCRHEVPVTSEPITVIHMDEDVVVVNKPASIPVSGVLPELYCQKKRLSLLSAERHEHTRARQRTTRGGRSTFSPHLHETSLRLDRSTTARIARHTLVILAVSCVSLPPPPLSIPPRFILIRAKSRGNCAC